MPWITRGLANGIVTSPYPKRPDGYGEAWVGSVTMRGAGPLSGGPLSGGPASAGELVCPTGAISAAPASQDPAVRPLIELDRGRCILCGRCVSEMPELFVSDPNVEVAVHVREELIESSTESSADLGARTAPEEDEGRELEQVRRELARRTRALRRSIYVRHVDAGSDGSEEWEVAALTNPVYDVQRLGIFFTASPRHADVLLVTGIGTVGMEGPLRETYEAMPHPKVVIAAGTDATSGGLLAEGYASHGGIGSILPVDVFVPGSPPSPLSLIHALGVAVGLLAPANRRSRGEPRGPEPKRPEPRRSEQ
jgi:Ni,Fe-hydrogenase III small subunit/ferredoxin